MPCLIIPPADCPLRPALTLQGQALGRDYDLICRQTTQLLPPLYPHIDTVGEDLVATGRELARLLIDRVAGVPADQLQTLHEPAPLWRSA